MSIPTDRPRSLFEPSRYLSKEETATIGQRVLDMAAGGGSTLVTIVSEWSGEVRWARNRTSLASDRRGNVIQIERRIDGAVNTATTNQIDDESLLGATRAAERLLRDRATSPPEFPYALASHTYPTPTLWSDATYGQATDARAKAVAPLMDAAEQAGLLSAGFASVGARAIAYVGTDIGPPMYAAQTLAECSTTVRDTQGTGSGWAGVSSYDLSRVSAATLGERAQQKCVASRNPVAIEPGRYTLIMEPQAVFELVRGIPTGWPPPTREHAESGNPTPWFDRVDPDWGVMTKLGQKVVDERVTIEHDPTDPELGIMPFQYETELIDIAPLVPIRWIDRGVLNALNYSRSYALRALNEHEGRLLRGSFRMSGGTTSLEEMIRTTKRGLLVTRFWGVRQLDQVSLLATGLTRDGLWLIENGEISRPVKNLRFTESPLFALNSIDQLGVPQLVFSPGGSAVVPPLKVRDFSFTSLVDAI